MQGELLALYVGEEGRAAELLAQCETCGQVRSNTNFLLLPAFAVLPEYLHKCGFTRKCNYFRSIILCSIFNKNPHFMHKKIYNAFSPKTHMLCIENGHRFFN